MISCTEFIPSYSELFSYLEVTHGEEEVRRFWKYLFEPDGKGIPLIRFIEQEGIRGCFTYWSGTLREEAADFTLYLNEKAGWYKCVMHKCPSKGRLLALQQEIGIVPYHSYCLHCDYYRHAVEKVGFKYIYDFEGVDHAACSLLIYDPEVFDGRIIIDENTEVLDVRASDNEYFHRDFHSSLNMGIDYLGENYGIEEVKAYLMRYTCNVYKPVFEAANVKGLEAIKEQILNTYEQEKAVDAVEMKLGDMELQVNVKYCPGVKHLLATGRTVSRWYRYATEFVMQTVAEKTGYQFEMFFYDEKTGAVQYRIYK